MGELAGGWGGGGVIDHQQFYIVLNLKLVKGFVTKQTR